MDPVCVLLNGQPSLPGEALKRARLGSRMSCDRLATTIDVARTSIYRAESARSDMQVSRWISALRACGYKVVIERIEA